MAPGSKSRVLNYDPATGEAIWEGGRIRPDDAVPMDEDAPQKPE